MFILFRDYVFLRAVKYNTNFWILNINLRSTITYILCFLNLLCPIIFRYGSRQDYGQCKDDMRPP
jgi:hypothetical protein